MEMMLQISFIISSLEKADNSETFLRTPVWKEHTYHQRILKASLLGIVLWHWVTQRIPYTLPNPINEVVTDECCLMLKQGLVEMEAEINTIVDPENTVQYDTISKFPAEAVAGVDKVINLKQQQNPSNNNHD